MVALAAALALQAVAPPPRTEVPLASFSAPNALFTCFRQAGLPSVYIDYHDAHRRMDFSRFDSDSQIIFDLSDPIKSVIYEGDEGDGRWIIRAEGPAVSARGRVANGTPVRIELIVPRNAGASFTVEAGDFREVGGNCTRAPERPHESSAAASTDRGQEDR